MAIRNFFKQFNTFQKAFITFGCLIGLPLGVLLVLLGAAALPFIGLPLWLAIPIFVILVTGNFASAGDYVGQSIDAIRSIKKDGLNIEKVATIFGCILGLALSIIAIPFHAIGVRFIVDKALIPIGTKLAYFFPLNMGQFGSAFSYIGRAIDNLYKAFVNFFKKKEPAPPPENQKVHKSYIFIHNRLKRSNSSPDLRRINTNQNSIFSRSDTHEKVICYNAPVTAMAVGDQQNIYIGKENDSYSIRP